MVTLYVVAGEVSIFLCDLHKLGSLPMHEKNFYDKVIPSVAELTWYGNEDKFLPKTCEYLFTTFHHLRKSKKNNVFIETQCMLCCQPRHFLDTFEYFHLDCVWPLDERKTFLIFELEVLSNVALLETKIDPILDGNIVFCTFSQMMKSSE